MYLIDCGMLISEYKQKVRDINQLYFNNSSQMRGNGVMRQYDFTHFAGLSGFFNIIICAVLNDNKKCKYLFM